MMVEEFENMPTVTWKPNHNFDDTQCDYTDSGIHEPAEWTEDPVRCSGCGHELIPVPEPPRWQPGNQ